MATVPASAPAPAAAPPCLRVSQASQAELATVLEWAAAEGWNPGVDDVETFFGADPGGFLVGHAEDGSLVAAVSAVRHSAALAFIGLFLCVPKLRGKGFGRRLFQAALELARRPEEAGGAGDDAAAAAATLPPAPARLLALDSVLEQQATYGRRGFVPAHHTRRFGGALPAEYKRPHAHVRRVREADVAALVELDASMAGSRRARYASAWFAVDGPPTRTTMVVANCDGGVAAAGTIRRCREGHKVGPLYARSAEEAAEVVSSLAAAVDAGVVFVDVPDPNPSGPRLVDLLQLTCKFETVRMYADGPPPDRPFERVFGEMTLELG